MTRLHMMPRVKQLRNGKIKILYYCTVLRIIRTYIIRYIINRVLKKILLSKTLWEYYLAGALVIGIMFYIFSIKSFYGPQGVL